MRHVVLTNEQGHRTGLAELVEAHTGTGQLHSAFSVYVLSPDASHLLVQQRAAAKMLFGGLWANTCCSHPFPDEDIVNAGERRLQEECGFTVPLQRVDSFVYRAEDPNGRGVEHEYDTVLLGYADTDTPLQPNPDEIAQLEWRSMENVEQELREQPEHFAPWFKLGLEKAKERITPSA